MAHVECPVCGGNVALQSDTEKGELLECSECGTDLEVTGVDPYSVSEASLTEEDWGE